VQQLVQEGTFEARRRGNNKSHFLLHVIFVGIAKKKEKKKKWIADTLRVQLWKADTGQTTKLWSAVRA
jgi:ribosomal protein L28